MIREQILFQITKLLTRRPQRSLSAGAQKRYRELCSFRQNYNLYITLYNLILDNYIRVRSAFQAMDEIFLFLIETCYPTQLSQKLYDEASPALYEQIHKKLFQDLLQEPYIQAFRQ